MVTKNSKETVQLPDMVGDNYAKSVQRVSRFSSAIGVIVGFSLGFGALGLP